MKYIIRHALKNLKRNTKRTVSLCLSISLSIAVVNWLLAFTFSTEKELTGEIIDHYVGKSQYVAQGFYQDDFSETITNKFLSGNLTNDYHTTKRTIIPAFLGGEKVTAGVQLVGIDPENEKKHALFYKTIESGKFLDSKISSQKEIILGSRLANKLEVHIGDEVVFLSQALDGSIANELLRVVGIFSFGGSDSEEVLAFTHIETTHEMMVMPPDSYHQLVSFSDLPDSPDKSIARLSWQELLPDVASSLKTTSTLSWFICFIVLLVICMGVSNTLFMTFREREKEFKTLSVIGVSEKWIITSLFVEVVLLCFISLVVGNLLAMALVSLFKFYPIPLTFMTGGKPVLIGGLKMMPEIVMTVEARYLILVSAMITLFMVASVIYPIFRTIQRSRDAVRA